MFMQRNEEHFETGYEGFTNAEEQTQVLLLDFSTSVYICEMLIKFERYRQLLEFGHQISQFATKMDLDDVHGPSNIPLRQRMNVREQRSISKVYIVSHKN